SGPEEPLPSNEETSNRPTLPVHADRETDLSRYGAISIARDPAEACAIEGVTAVGEVLVVERVERDHSEFDVGALLDIGPLDQAEVSLREMRAVERVKREIAECARSRRAENAVLEPSADQSTGRRVSDDVQQGRINKEHTHRSAEHTDVLLELVERHSNQLGRVEPGVGRVERGAVRIEVERQPALPGNDRSKGPTLDRLSERAPGIAQESSSRTKRQVVDNVGDEAMPLVLH